VRQLTPVILATQKVEIRGNMVQGQVVHETSYQPIKVRHSGMRLSSHICGKQKWENGVQASPDNKARLYLKSWGCGSSGRALASKQESLNSNPGTAKGGKKS
jgi:hypothetical protein